MPIALAELNTLDRAGFVAAVGHVFEHSPQFAAAAWEQRPFAGRADLHVALCQAVRATGPAAQLALIQAHPDLAGKLARAGALGPESTREQAAAGLDQLSPAEYERFTAFNTAYRERFGFPFVICARANTKQAMLEAFPIRLQHSRAEEIATALAEIEQIAWLRLVDSVE